MITTRKFAWLPVIVWTWRPTPSRAIVWLQGYFVLGEADKFSRLNGNPEPGGKYCTRLGVFSIEF